MNLNPAYVGPRPDVAALIPEKCRRFLDLGCATGALGELIKRSRHGISVVGVELDPDMATAARDKLDRVIAGDILDVLTSNTLGEERFDCIIAADVLEHLSDPWSVVGALSGLLADRGVVIASIPNIRHYTTLCTLLFRKHWPYRDRGIHDRTHLRFFAQKNVEQLFVNAGFHIDRLRRNYRVFERPYRINRYSRLLAIPPLRDLLTYQYLIVASLTHPRRSGTSQTP
jgi:2-polyprenyl-3-methyl-5-hydroxy-6-metoxy-1,4-benzoquinol methylase